MDNLEFIKKFYFGTYTEQERQYYIDNLMGELEKQIGKPMFEFNSQDEVKYQVLEYNSRQGNLKRYDCPKCKNKGCIAVCKDGYFALSDCDCLQTRKTLKLIEESGLGTLFDTCTFDKYETSEDWQANILEKAKQFVQEQNKWFYIQGNSGCGKTMICTAIVKELILKGKQARYMMWVDESGKLKQAKANNPDEYQTFVRELKEAEVLYIDDFLKVGKNETPTTADINLAFEILNYRSANKLTTLLSSERTIGEVIALDEAVGSRIAELTKPYYYLVVSKDIKKNYRLK